MIYLDHGATAPPRREVLEAMWPYLTQRFGNPASHHELGEEAKRALDAARGQVADALGARPGEVVFTSGGTEADNAAVKGIALAAPRGRHVLVSAIEHSAVLESAAWLARLGFEVEHIPVDHEGFVTPEALAALVRPDTTLVSVQLANNEVGTIQPVAELAEVAGDVPFHTDAVQAAGWTGAHLRDLGVQAMSISGHKLGTPKGMGVLALRAGTPFEPLIHGGGQQDDLRSGTESVAAAWGMAAALSLPLPDVEAVSTLRDTFIAAVVAAVPGAELTGSPTHRLPGHASFVVPSRSGESITVDLAARGVMCSSGSACSAGDDEPSHVLTAMGYPREVAQTALRFTFGAETTEAELDETLAALVSSTS